jgi:hypothetical protein
LNGFKVKVFDEEPAHGFGQNGSASANSEPDGHTPNAEVDASGMTTFQDGTTSFHSSLASLCSAFLADYYAYMANPKAHSNLPTFLHPRRLSTPKVAQLSRPFTIVSLHSFARGAAEGMTTLTMGSVVFRELWSQARWKPRGWSQGNYEHERSRNPGGPGTVNAAVWLLPYRSLGEGKRVKFEQGDYSYPSKDRVGSIKGLVG